MLLHILDKFESIEERCSVSNWKISSLTKQTNGFQIQLDFYFNEKERNIQKKRLGGGFFSRIG